MASVNNFENYLLGLINQDIKFLNIFEDSVHVQGTVTQIFISKKGYHYMIIKNGPVEYQIGVDEFNFQIKLLA